MFAPLNNDPTLERTGCAGRESSYSRIFLLLKHLDLPPSKHPKQDLLPATPQMGSPGYCARLITIPVTVYEIYQ